MTLLDIAAIVLICATPLDWYATAVQWQAYRDAGRINPYRRTALYARVLTGALLSLGATIVAGGAIIELTRTDISRDALNDVLVGIFVLISLPQLNWLRLYWTGRFSGH